MTKQEWLNLSIRERIDIIKEEKVSKSMIEMQYALKDNVRKQKQFIPYKHPVKINDAFYGYGLKLEVEYGNGNDDIRVVLIPIGLQVDAIIKDVAHMKAWLKPIYDELEQIKSNFADIVIAANYQLVLTHVFQEGSLGLSIQVGSDIDGAMRVYEYTKKIFNNLFL
ncbi:MAG: hypothetical protein ACOCQR_00090 [bacterium]